MDESVLLLQEDNTVLRHTLALVLEKNEEMERRLNSIEHQTSDCLNRLSDIESDPRRLVKKKGNEQGITAQYDSLGNTTQQALAVARATNNGLAQLERAFDQFRKKIRARVKRNSLGVTSLTTSMAKTTSSVGKLTDRVSTIRDGVREATKEVELLNGVVDAHTLKIQQIAKEGPFKSTSDEDASAVDVENLKLKLEVVGSHLDKLAVLVDGHTKAISAQQAAINGMVIDSVGETDPALAAVMSNFATDMNATKDQVDELESRVEECEARLDTVLESLSSGNGTANGTASCSSCEAQLAVIASATEQNTLKISELERNVMDGNSTDVLELQLVVAALSDSMNDTAQELEELYLLVESYVEPSANSSNASMGNATGDDDVSSLRETIDEIYLQLSNLQTAILNSSSTGGNETDESSVELLHTLVSLMRGELNALTITVRTQGKHINATAGSLGNLNATVSQLLELSKATNDTNTSSTISLLLALQENNERVSILEDALFTNESTNRLDDLELALLETRDVVASLASHSHGGNVTSSSNVSSDVLEDLVFRVADLEDALFTNDSVSRVSLLEAALNGTRQVIEDILSSSSATNSSNSSTLCDSEDVCSALAELSSRLDDLEEGSSSNETQALSVRVDKVETRLQKFIAQLRNATSDSLSIPDAQLAALLSTVEENSAKIQELGASYDDWALVLDSLASSVNASSASSEKTTERIKELTTTVGNHDSSIADLSASLSNLAVSVQATGKKVKTLESNFSSFEEEAELAIAALQASIKNSTVSCPDCSGSIGDSAGQLGDVLKTLNVTSVSLSSLESVVAEHTKTLSTNIKAVDDLSSLVSAHDSRIGELEDDFLIIPAIEAKVNASQNQIKTLKSTLSADVKSINEDLDLVAKLIDENTQDVTSMASAVNATTAGLKVLSDKVNTLGGASDMKKFACISDESTDKDIYFSGCNVHITNGEDYTESTNSYGNLVIGYNDATSSCKNNCTRSGSHNIILGTNNAYSSYGGIVTGELNSILGKYATITGGTGNEVSGMYASVSGGEDNVASGFASSVSGGRNNIASAYASSVVGARGLTAQDAYDTMPWDLSPEELRALAETYLTEP